jgi:hypothetical protein
MTVYFLDVRLALVFVRCGVFFGLNLLSNVGLGLPNKSDYCIIHRNGFLRVSKMMQFILARVTALYNKRRCSSVSGGI